MDTDIWDVASLTLPQCLEASREGISCTLRDADLSDGKLRDGELTVVLMTFSVDTAGVAVNAPSAVAAPMPVTLLTPTSAARLPAELMEADDPPCRYQGLRLMLDTR